MLFLPDTEETRAGMIAACQWMNAQGLNQGTSGNISVRVEAGVLITPSGVPYDAMTPEALVLLPHGGEPEAAANPSSEWRFHQRLLQARPDMAVVLHAHPTHCTALSIQRSGIPACHYMVAAFGGGDIPLAGYALFGSDALAEEVAQAMADRTACLMANHGATVLGETLAKAQWRLEELEVLARGYLLSHIGGAPTLLTEAQVAEALVQIQGYGTKA